MWEAVPLRGAMMEVIFFSVWVGMGECVWFGVVGVEGLDRRDALCCVDGKDKKVHPIVSFMYIFCS